MSTKTKSLDVMLPESMLDLIGGPVYVSVYHRDTDERQVCLSGVLESIGTLSGTTVVKMVSTGPNAAYVQYEVDVSYGVITWLDTADQTH